MDLKKFALESISTNKVVVNTRLNQIQNWSELARQANWSAERQENKRAAPNGQANRQHPFNRQQRGLKLAKMPLWECRTYPKRQTGTIANNKVTITARPKTLVSARLWRAVVGTSPTTTALLQRFSCCFIRKLRGETPRKARQRRALTSPASTQNTLS
jgi:hypothetical protein